MMRSLALTWLSVVSLTVAPLLAGAVPAKWAIIKDQSHLGFTGRMNEETFSGSFGRWDADIIFDPSDLAGSKVTATIDVASVKTGDQTRDEALPTDDWFAVAAFPRAVFTSRKITNVGADHYVAEGDLTVRKATRPVSLNFTLVIEGNTATMSGKALLDRSAFGVGEGQFKGGDTVALEVEVNIGIVAKR
jgi:polyisoprenoid-binding protein YceI